MPTRRPRIIELVNEIVANDKEGQQTPEDQWDEYHLLYHGKLLYEAGSADPVGITMLRREKGMLKIDVYPIDFPEVVDPLAFNEKLTSEALFCQDEPT